MNEKRYLRVVCYYGGGLLSYSEEYLRNFNLTASASRFPATSRKINNGINLVLLLVCFCLQTFISRAQGSTNSVDSKPAQERRPKQIQAGGNARLLEGCWRWGTGETVETFLIKHTDTTWDVECLSCPEYACTNVSVSNDRIHFDWVTGHGFGRFSVSPSSGKLELTGDYSWHSHDYTIGYPVTFYRIN